MVVALRDLTEAARSPLAHTAGASVSRFASQEAALVRKRRIERALPRHLARLLRPRACVALEVCEAKDGGWLLVGLVGGRKA